MREFGQEEKEDEAVGTQSTLPVPPVELHRPGEEYLVAGAGDEVVRDVRDLMPVYHVTMLSLRTLKREQLVSSEEE